MYFRDLWSQTTEPFQFTASEKYVTKPTTMNELRSVFNNLKSNKGPGQDLINLELCDIALA
jgi:hypothetical protein